MSRTRRRPKAPFRELSDAERARRLEAVLAERDPAPELWISTADAGARALSDGDAICVHNQRGAFEATVRLIDPRVDPATRLGHVRLFIGAPAGLRVGTFTRGDEVPGLGGTPDWARMVSYRPIDLAERVRIPTLFIDMSDEELFDRTRNGQAAYERIRDNAPARYEVFEGKHYDVYTGSYGAASDLAVEWFQEHLSGGATPPAAAPPSR